MTYAKHKPKYRNSSILVPQYHYNHKPVGWLSRLFLPMAGQPAVVLQPVVW